MWRDFIQQEKENMKKASEDECQEKMILLGIDRSHLPNQDL